MKLKIRVARWERIPQGYGIAYEESDRLVVVCYPIPLNIVIHWLSRTERWFRYGFYRSHKQYEVWEKTMLHWCYYNIACCSYLYAKEGYPEWKNEKNFHLWFFGATEEK